MADTPPGVAKRKISYDAILIAGAGLVGVLLLMRGRSGSSSSAGTTYAPGPAVADQSALENGILSDPAFWNALSQQQALNAPLQASPGTPAPRPAPLPTPAAFDGAPSSSVATSTAGNSFIGPTGWLPAGVAAESPLSFAVFGIYEHDLGRPPSAQEETAQLKSIQTIGWLPFENAVWNSPESKTFQAVHPGLQGPGQ